MVYDGLQSSFVSLAWPWSGRSLPKGEPVGVLGPWTGAQCGQVPCPPATNYLTTQRLTGWYLVTWLVGWPVAAGKLAGWLPIEQNVNLTLPKAETSCGQVFDYFGHLDLWSNVPPLETSHSQVCYYFRQNDLWLDVPPSRDILWPSVLWLWSDWHLVTCTPTQRSGFGSGSHLVRLLVMLTFGQTFFIAFLICDYKSTSSKVVPWCSNTSDWWWKDMSKFVWRENSLYNISLHFMQEYVIRWHRYKTANHPWK